MRTLGAAWRVQCGLAAHIPDLKRRLGTTTAGSGWSCWPRPWARSSPAGRWMAHQSAWQPCCEDSGCGGPVGGHNPACPGPKGERRPTVSGRAVGGHGPRDLAHAWWLISCWRRGSQRALLGHLPCRRGPCAGRAHAARRQRPVRLRPNALRAGGCRSDGGKPGRRPSLVFAWAAPGDPTTGCLVPVLPERRLPHPARERAIRRTPAAVCGPCEASPGE